MLWPIPETAMGSLYNCLVGASPCTPYVIRSSPLYGVEALPAKKIISNSTTSRGDRQKAKRYPGCLAHGVRGVFYSVVANRRQPTPTQWGLEGGTWMKSTSNGTQMRLGRGGGGQQKDYARNSLGQDLFLGCTYMV